MRTKLILATLTATVVMAFATSASARNLSGSHGRLWNITWTSLQLRSSGLVAADCALTLEGSFHYGTLGKVAHSLIGHVTRARLGTCRTGSATVLTGSLPWHITYEGFEGTLPNITGIRVALLGAQFRIHEPILGTECLATSNPERAFGIARLDAGSGNRNVIGVTSESGARIRCGSLNGNFEGTGAVRSVEGELLLVRLI